MTAEQPDWVEDHTLDEHRTCQNCGAHVTKQAARTMGDEDGRVYACPSCTPHRDLQNAAAARPDYDPERDRMRTTRQGFYPMDNRGDRTDA